MKDFRSFFEEAKRLCQPGGFILFSDMHPALRLWGNRAHFDDPISKKEIRLESVEHQVSDYVNAALQCGLRIGHMGEHKMIPRLAARFPKAEKFLGWLMLLTLRLHPGT